jgi:NADPH-dependent curcumin reductase CurA
MTTTNTQILFARRPKGWPDESCFEIAERPIPTAGDGEIVVRVHYLSLDPYMRGRMNEGKSYAARLEIGDVMIGGAIGEIVESRHAKLAKGDFVVGAFGWQEYAKSNGAGVMKVDPKRVPLSAYLGAVGMPGVTAYIGLFDIGAPKAGETVCVSAAAGAVGSVVGQLAKMHGCRVVGIAGGKEKCDFVTSELGFDACIDYKRRNLDGDLREATPNGIDVYFENVGGETLDAVLKRLNAFARIPLCGLVSQYNETESYGVKNFVSLLTNRVKLEGFIVSERMDRWPEALQKLGALVAEGKLRYRETIAEGLRDAPRAFLGMLRGENVGKQLVKMV